MCDALPSDTLASEQTAIIHIMIPPLQGLDVHAIEIEQTGLDKKKRACTDR